MTLLVVKGKLLAKEYLMIVHALLFLLFTYSFMSLLDIKPSAFFSILKRQKSNSGYHLFVDYILRFELSREIPKYKFYSEIMLTLVKLRREHGVNVRPAALELRKAAGRDHREGKRIKEEFMGLVFQYFAIGAFTWFFIFHIQNTLDVTFSSVSLTILASWQFIGILLGCSLFFFLKKQLFNSLSSFFYSAYIFRSLILVSRPLSEIISISKIQEVKTKGNLNTIYKRFFTLIEQLKTKGSIPIGEFTNMVQELWDHYDDQLLLLKKYTLGLKLSLILFFVFPGFLFAIYLSMNSMSILA